jgi:transposase
MTIPGISYTLGAIILAEIGDINRFSNPSKLLAFVGMEPSTYQSGNFYASKTPMVKIGSKHLRWAIMQAVRLVAMRDSIFREYLIKKQSEGKHYFVTLSHAGKKLIRVLYTLMKNNLNYQPQQ